jgi:beta-phosphoglucomutase-like phosphatase (HAD superfamily)
MKIGAVIFDCDGTLVASEEAHMEAWQTTLNNRGLEFTDERRRICVGQSDIDTARLLAQGIRPGCADEILAEKRTHYLGLSQGGLPAIDGAVDFVWRLAKERERLGLKMGVASAALKVEIESHLMNLGIRDLFEVVLSGYDDLEDYSDPEGVNKPKPYIYLHAAKLLGVHPTRCIAIEDSYTGVASAASAGCITVAVPNHFTKHHDLSRATVRIDTLADLTVERFLEIVK